MSGRAGGISEEKEADEDVQKVTDQVYIRKATPAGSHTVVENQ